LERLGEGNKMSFDGYVENTGKEYCKDTWIEYMMEIHEMGYMQALRESNDLEL